MYAGGLLNLHQPLCCQSVASQVELRVLEAWDLITTVRVLCMIPPPQNLMCISAYSFLDSLRLILAAASGALNEDSAKMESDE